MITTKNLTYQYHTKSNPIVFPDLDVQENSAIVITGKSGVGKTTFLHLLAGLIKPTTGEIHINNTNLNQLDPSKRDKFIGKNIGIVFQKKHALASLTILENIETRLYFCNLKPNYPKIHELLKELDLHKHIHKKPKQLSEGQLQRLSIALAVVHEPKIILADEPTSSLDDENCNQVINLLLNQANKFKANLIVITHDQRVTPLFSINLKL